MLRKRNLVSMLMAATLSLGTLGVAFADDSGADFAPVPQTPEEQTDIIVADGDSGSDFVPVPQTPALQSDDTVIWADDGGAD